MPTRTEVHNQGRKAYPKPECPYEDGTSSCSIWWQGFREARAEKKEKEQEND